MKLKKPFSGQSLDNIMRSKISGWRMQYTIILTHSISFGLGTKLTVLGKSKFVLFVDGIHNDIFRFIICRTSSLTRLSLANIVIKITFMII